jgi:hypothetical protein
MIAITNNSPQVVGATAETLKTHRSHCNQPGFKRKPLYWQTLKNYPHASLLMIAVDSLSAKLIHRLKGICLLCEGNPNDYDLDVCVNREVWVLYAQAYHYTTAMHLAYAVQYHGADPVWVILVDKQLAGVTYG